MHRQGHDLRYRYMKENTQPLFFAAKQFFGSYVNAVKQAGINYRDMSQVQLKREREAKTRAAADSDQVLPTRE